MAPHAPEDGGWTVVTKVRSKAAENGEKKARVVQPEAVRNLLDQKKSFEFEAPLVGWGGSTNFYGTCRHPPKQKRGSEKKPKDEVAVLVEKVQQARLAVETSEFYRQFLEEWRAKALSKTLKRSDEVKQVSCKAEGREEILGAPQPGPDVGYTASETSVLSKRASLEGASEWGQKLDTSEITSVESLEASSDGASSVGSGQLGGVLSQSAGTCNVGLVDANPPEEEQQLDVVMYGVGSISGSETSRCQLAFALLLKDLLEKPNRLLVYDPALTELDQEAIQRLGCKIIATNEEGRRTVDRPTLFYMPHCEEWLYDNVLLANWQAERLAKVSILGNSFSAYHDRFSSCSASRQAKMWHIKHVASVLEEVRLNDHGFSNASAFNVMSWHTFQGAKKDGVLLQTRR